MKSCFAIEAQICFANSPQARVACARFLKAVTCSNKKSLRGDGNLNQASICNRGTNLQSKFATGVLCTRTISQSRHLLQ